MKLYEYDKNKTDNCQEEEKSVFFAVNLDYSRFIVEI